MEVIMDLEKMNNILYSLTSLEEFYKEHAPVNLSMDDYSSYITFFNSNYIKMNNLSKVYFPYPDINTSGSITKFNELDENLLILEDLNIALAKHINFSPSLVHSNKYFQCIYIYEGSGVLNLENKKLTLVTGDFFVMPPNLKHSISMNSDSICIYVEMRNKYITSGFFDLFNQNSLLVGFFNQVILSGANNNYILFHTGINNDIRETVLHLYIEYLYGDEFQNVIMECYLKLLFSFLFRYKSSDIDSTITSTNLESHYNEILNYINKNFRSATLISTAEHIHLSKQYICRIINQVTGSNFSTLLIDIKLKKVKLYLTETTLRLEDIAEYTGFSDVSHLSRIFKIKFGIPPSKYRLQNKEQSSHTSEINVIQKNLTDI
jgi:AraC-like DNA-binding protein